MLPSELEIALDPTPWKKSFQRTGLWRAKVINVNDPQKRGRIQVRITLLHPASTPPGTTLDPPTEEAGVLSAPPGEGVPNDALPWAEPAFPWGGNKNPSDPVGLQTEGFFALPSVGSTVWVGFDQGFTGRPVWLGSWLKSGDLPEEVTDPRYIRLMKTPGGHLLIFDDTPGATKIKLATLASGVDGPHTVRFVELNDQSQKLTIHNSANDATDPRTIVQDASVKKTIITEGLDRKVELDQTATKLTIQQNLLQTIVQDGVLNKTTITNATHTIVLDSVAGSITISAISGASTIVLTAGTIVFTVGGITMTFNGGSGDADIATSGDITIGTGAVKGVALDSLLTVVTLMATAFNTHHHGASPLPDTVMVPPVFGVDSSATVLAKQ